VNDVGTRRGEHLGRIGPHVDVGTDQVGDRVPVERRIGDADHGSLGHRADHAQMLQPHPAATEQRDAQAPRRGRHQREAGTRVVRTHRVRP
jgi:hypothetical protein